MKKYFTNLFQTLAVLGLFLLPASMNAQCGTGETFHTYCYTFGEVNTVAFEVCPSAGMIAEADITQGTFDPFFPNTLTVYQGASGSGTGGTIVFGPTGGTPMGTFNDVSGNTITGTVADECLIFVINTVAVPGFDCATGSFLAVEACGRSLPATSVSLVLSTDEVCINGGVIAGITGGSPPGGTYSGLGVTDNGGSFSFDPAAAGVGVGLETVTYTNGGTATDDINVLAAPSFTAPADICINAAPVTLTGGSPAGGTYSGPGVVGNTFNPGLAGIGVHPLSYTTDCGTVTDNIEVLDCGCPGGTTTYFYCYDNFEANNVAFEVCPTAGMAAQGTIVQGSFEVGFDNLTVYEGTTGSGTSGTLLFGPDNGDLTGNVISGSVADNCLIFVVNSDNIFSCADGDQTGLQVCGESIAAGTVVNFVATIQTVCIEDGTQTIGGGTPIGGMYSGDGVTDDENGETFTFDPVAAGAGPITVTYENGGSATDDINVIDLMVAMGDPGMTFCPDDGPQFLSNLGTPAGAGGMYSGDGVTDFGDGVNFLFNPMGAGEGTHPVTYSYMDGNGCMSSDVVNFVVAYPVVEFTDPGDFCIDAGVQMGLGGGTPEGGEYTGPGVTDDDNGTSFTFDPAAATVGMHTLFYTYTDPVNGCVETAEVMIEVFGLPTISCPTDIAQGTDAGICEATVTVPAPTVTGGCFGTTVTNDYNGTANASDTYDIGSTTVVFTVVDGDGNSATCSMTVTIEDNEPPVAGCQDVTVMLDTNGDGATTAAAVESGSTDNCGAVNTEGVSPSTFDCMDLGANTVTLTVNDGNGNTGTCTATASVQDNIAPTAVCMNTTIEFNGEEEILLTIDDVLDQINSSDNCDEFNLVSATPASVTCDQIGEVVSVDVVIEDGSGNLDNCTAMITVDGFICGFGFDPDGIDCTGGSTADYDPNTETFTITSETCYDPAFYSANDSHGFIQSELCGDGEIIAEVTGVTGNGWGGITMRETLLSGSKMLQLMIDGTSLTMRELRQSTNGIAFAHQFQTSGRNWLRLTRNGIIFGAYHSTDGVNWVPVLITQIPMTTCINIGLVTANKAPSGTVTATFGNVEVLGSPAPLTTTPALDDAEFGYTYQPAVDIYPNPTTGETFVDLSDYQGKKANIRIFSSTGQFLKRVEIDEVQVPTQLLQLDQYQNGLYLIQIEAEGFEMVTKKLTLMK